jgi:MGT family glycosyltransferase
MSEILMTTWHGAGNTPPLMSVAAALVARGHHVRVLADAVLKPDVEAAGAEHVAWTRAPQRTAPGREADVFRDWESDDPAVNFGLMRDRVAVGPAAAYAHDTRAEISRVRPDLLLTEVLIFGPLLAAEAEDVPAAVLNPTINIVPAPGVPPFGFGFDLATDPAGRERDEMFTAIAVEAWDVALPALNDARREHGLAPLGHVLDQARTAALTLVLTSDALDFRAQLPPVVRYAGPRLDDPAWVEPWSSAVDGDAPLVLAALSSDYQRQEAVLNEVVAALGTLDVRALVTTGRGIDPEPFAAVAGSNVEVVESAPHSAVLRDAAAVVTHCGHGTTVKSLAAGVPLVCLPMGRDQLDIAARVVHAGAGVRLPADATADQIADAVRQVIAEPSYAEAARRIARRIAEETAHDRAVELIEGLLATAPSP